MKKVLFCLVILTVFTFSLLAGGRRAAPGSSTNYIRFAWWGNTVRDERTRRVVSIFEQQNPGVTVETETTNWDEYWSKLNTQAAAGSLPDVMQQDYAFITMYNNRNLLVDMDQFARNGSINLSNWPKDIVDSGRLGGKLIALSLGTNTWGIGVDPAILQRAGVTVDDTNWTWKDYEQIALTVFRNTGVQTMPIAEFDQIVEHVVRQYGTSMFSGNGKSLGWSSNAAALAAVKEILLDMQLRLKAAGALYDPEDAFIAVAMEEYPLSNGKTWNNYHWSNEHTGNQEAAGTPLEYYICPTVNGNKAPYGTYLQPSQFLSMLSSSKNQDLGAKFVNFFLNNLEANRILMAERGIPAPTDVRSDLASRVDPAMKYMFDFINRVTPFTSPIDPPAPDSVDEVRDMTRAILLQCLTGQISADAAMTQMVRTANDVLSR